MPVFLQEAPRVVRLKRRRPAQPGANEAREAGLTAEETPGAGQPLPAGSFQHAQPAQHAQQADEEPDWGGDEEPEVLELTDSEELTPAQTPATQILQQDGEDQGRAEHVKCEAGLTAMAKQAHTTRRRG